MADDQRTFQFAASAEECALFRQVRRLQTDPLEPKLQRTLDLALYAGDRYIGSYGVDATQLIQEFVHAGAYFLQKLLSEQEPEEPEEQSVGGDQGVQLNDDDDSVLGTKSISQDSKADDVDEQLMSWDTVRRELPSYVKDITFFVSQEVLSPNCEEQLRNQFPGVIITCDPPKVEEREAQEMKETEMPKGIKKMTIELDQAEVAQDPQLAIDIPEQFPWASIESNPAPNVSRKPIVPAIEIDSVSLPRLDPAIHLADLADYAATPPADDEFGYKFPLIEGWDLLPYARKLEVAQARAIQDKYGENVNGDKCNHCTARGYECRVYYPQPGDASHTSLFGHSCQNCRLQETACDFPVAASDHLSPTLPSPNLTGLRLPTRDVSVMRMEEASRTSLINATEDPSSTSHIHASETNSRSGDIDADDQESENPPELDLESPSLDCQTTSFMPADTMLERAQSFGLELSESVRELTRSIYKTWRARGEIIALDENEVTTEDFYTSLVSLYILADKRSESRLRYAVLLRFQYTNCQHMESFPDFETAVQAYKHLPPHSPLCEWIATVYAYLWGTQSDGNYETFITDRPHLDPVALSKLLYGIAYIRDPFTRGWDAAVMTEWCTTHNHRKRNSPERAQCEEIWSSLTEKYQNTLAKFNASRLKEAKSVIEELGGPASTKQQSKPSKSSASSNKGKRKAESSPAPSSKSNKRGKKS